jgi:hypothetical protein
MQIKTKWSINGRVQWTLMPEAHTKLSSVNLIITKRIEFVGRQDFNWNFQLRAFIKLTRSDSLIPRFSLALIQNSDVWFHCATKRKEKVDRNTEHLHQTVMIPLSTLIRFSILQGIFPKNIFIPPVFSH